MQSPISRIILTPTYLPEKDLSSLILGNFIPRHLPKKDLTVLSLQDSYHAEASSGEGHTVTTFQDHFHAKASFGEGRIVTISRNTMSKHLLEKNLAVSRIIFMLRHLPEKDVSSPISGNTIQKHLLEKDLTVSSL